MNYPRPIYNTPVRPSYYGPSQMMNPGFQSRNPGMNSGMNSYGPIPSPYGAYGNFDGIKYEPPINKKLFIILGLITLFLIILIVILDIVFYSNRSFIFKPYKAKPYSATNAAKLLGAKAVTSVYYPNGEPDPTTGIPAGSKDINTAIQTQITNNLTTSTSAAAAAFAPSVPT